jgi:hypothetical protein
MSLDITLTVVRETSVFERNITHNLNRMADEAGIYGVIWRPEENGIETAADGEVRRQSLGTGCAKPQRELPRHLSRLR